jgi:hypothetical protein
MANGKRDPDNPQGAPPPVVQAVERALCPIVALLLDHGVGLPALVALLKGIYVQMAELSLAGAARAANDSRVSVMTGVHRKDVRRLRHAAPSEVRVPAAVLQGAKVVAHWSARQDFRDGRGRPAPLPRLRSEGGARSFEALVAAVTRDVGARALLEELLRLGVVRLDSRDRVCLNQGAFVPRRGLEEKAYYFGKNLHDHASAAAHNLKGDGEPFLDRSVHYVELAERSAGELARLARRAGMRALVEVNRAAYARKQRDRTRGDAHHRVHFGVYFFSERHRK